MVAQWFPKVGVRVGAPGFETWHCPSFHGHTEFFADFGTYDVRLTVPDTHVVAATGVLTAAADLGDGTRKLTYRAEDVHDFAWMIDPHMEVMTGRAKVGEDQVEVRVYHRPRQRAFARRHLQAGIGAIEEFSKLLVPYPWSVMSIIDPPPDAAGAGGMEYPTLVTTLGDHVTARPGVRVPEFITIHEVGHNWFQGLLASNEVEEAWLDEGVNEWATAVVMARLYGEKQSAIDWLGWRAEAFRVRKALGGPLGGLPSPIATAADAYPDVSAYGQASYDKTMQALRTLELVVGRERFARAMAEYATAWAFRHPRGQDLFASLEASLGEELRWFIAPAFYGTGAVDYSVRSATCEPQHPPRGVFGEGAERRTVATDDSPDTGTWT
jgi:aminopeptidase N